MLHLFSHRPQHASHSNPRGGGHLLVFYMVSPDLQTSDGVDVSLFMFSCLRLFRHLSSRTVTSIKDDIVISCGAVYDNVFAATNVHRSRAESFFTTILLRFK